MNLGGSAPAALSFFIRSFVSLFVIVNAIGNAAVFSTLLQKYNEDEKKTIIRKAHVVGGVALLVVTLTGNLFFKLLGIEIYSFRMAGGILLGIVSIEMLYGRKTQTQSGEEKHYEERDEISVMPLGIPLITGPGTLTTGIVLYGTAGTLLHRMILVLTIFIVFFISYVILVRAGKIIRYLGKTGTTVAIRIMGLMLLSVAVQFLIGGITAAFFTSPK